MLVCVCGERAHAGRVLQGAGLGPACRGRVLLPCCSLAARGAPAPLPRLRLGFCERAGRGFPPVPPPVPRARHQSPPAQPQCLPLSFLLETPGVPQGRDCDGGSKEGPAASRRRDSGSPLGRPSSLCLLWALGGHPCRLHSPVPWPAARSARAGALGLARPRSTPAAPPACERGRRRPRCGAAPCQPPGVPRPVGGGVTHACRQTSGSNALWAWEG